MKLIAIVIHRHSLRYYHTRVYNSVNGVKGGVAVKKGWVAVRNREVKR